MQNVKAAFFPDGFSHKEAVAVTYVPTSLLMYMLHETNQCVCCTNSDVFTKPCKFSISQSNLYFTKSKQNTQNCWIDLKSCPSNLWNLADELNMMQKEVNDGFVLKLHAGWCKKIDHYNYVSHLLLVYLQLYY